MEIKRCIDVEIGWVHQAFQIGFSDYLVKMDFTLDEFTKRFFGPEGNDLMHSHIALDQLQPIGLILGGIKEYEGLKTMRCGTLCIHPDYRGTGVAQALMDVHNIHAANNDCKQLYLEVIANNERAIRFYEKQGYNRMYDLRYYSFQDAQNFNYTNVGLFDIESIKIEELYFLRRNKIDVHLNWQNDIEYIEKASGQKQYGIKEQGRLIGAISANQTGRISFIWVDIDFRAKGIARQLISYVIQKLQLTTVTSSFSNHAILEGFYKKLGFEKASLSQYEYYLFL